MIKTLTLKQAVSEAFDIDGRTIPEFTSSKPLKEARAWLDRENRPYTYERGPSTASLKAGSVIVFTRGAGSPQYAVFGENQAVPGGTQILAALIPKSKSQARRETAMNVSDDTVESTPVITEAPEDQSEPQMTVTSPDAPKRRTSRRRK